MRRAACRLQAVPQLPLVVGGAGQLGRHMLRLLAEAGCREARVIDLRPPAGAPEGLDLDFRKHRLGFDNSATLPGVLEGVDCVFNALTADVQHATERDFMRTNVRGVEELLQSCQTAGVPRFVHISSIAVTDHFSPSIDQTEEDELPSLDEYVSPYDRSKREGEDAVLAANGRGQLATVSLRAGGIIAGPRDFTCRSLLYDRPGNVVTLDESALIDFVAAEDVCRAALLAWERLESPAVSGQAFFVSKGEAIRPQEIATIIAERLGWQLTLLPPVAQSCIGFGLQAGHVVKAALGQDVPGIPPHDFMRIALTQKTFDNSRAVHTLGFESQVSIKEALERVVAEFEQER